MQQTRCWLGEHYVRVPGARPKCAEGQGCSGRASRDAARGPLSPGLPRAASDHQAGASVAAVGPLAAESTKGSQ